MKLQTRPPRRPFLAALTLATTSMLAACGGGSDSDVIDLAQLKGRWVSPAGAKVAMTTVILPDASGKASVWALLKDGSALSRLVLSSDGYASGKGYALSPANLAGKTVMGKIATQLTADPKRISFTDADSKETFDFDLSDTLSTPAVQADAAGTWTATTKATKWTATITAAGSITGSSTTGCSYTGTLTAQTSSSVYDLQFQESCPDGGQTAFNGIATLDATKSRLTGVAVTTDTTRGVALFLAK